MQMFLSGLLAFSAITAPDPPPQQGTNKAILGEPLFLTSVVDAVKSRKKNEGEISTGPYITFGTGVSGAGWISTGPGYRRMFGDRFLLDMSAVVSWRQYMSGRARVEVRPRENGSLTLGAQLLAQDWTQVQYYGTGPDSLAGNRSQFRLRANDLTVDATLNPNTVVDVRVRAGMLSRPGISRATGWNRGDYPDTQALFAGAQAPGLTAQPRYWHGDISVSADTLDHADHPTRGLMVELAAAQFHDRDLDRFSFRRYEGTAIGFVPVIGNLWTIGARAKAVGSSTSDGHDVPFYMLPSLGKSVLRGFETDRFRDRNLMALNLESRLAIFQHLDLAVFADFGRVAPRFGGLGDARTERSMGLGLRLHTGDNTFFRIDAARARGAGWQVLVKLNESLGHSRHQRWATVVPVVR